jgi:hypothetical protein
MPRSSPERARSRPLAFDGPQRSIYIADGSHDRHNGKAWSVMDVEDLRDYAKVMTTDDLATLLMRSRHEVQKKLIELGLAPMKGPSGTSPGS